tara:strand:+ start:1969 stop:2160 length:192 start_codon:yes stop_codon:yes gene_type:complete
MPEYKAVIKSKIKGEKPKKESIFASCFSDAEKIANSKLKDHEYLDSLDSMNFAHRSVRKIESK